MLKVGGFGDPTLQGLRCHHFPDVAFYFVDERSQSLPLCCVRARKGMEQTSDVVHWEKGKIGRKRTTGENKTKKEKKIVNIIYIMMV